MAKTKLKKIEDCTSLLEIEVQKTDIDKAFEEVYGEITKIANIPGFRTGKAPVELVKKHYARDAREEVLKRLIPESYKDALAEHGMRPIGLPEIMDVKFDETNSLLFKARVDTRPSFKLKDYKRIKLDKRKAAVSDEDVNKTLENLREINARYSSVEDRPVKMGDHITADVTCSVDGKEIHKKRENIWLHIDKEAVIPGLPEKIVGMNRLEERDVEVVLPEKYPDKKMAGKTAVYHVKVKDIKIRQLPEMDDELAKDLGKGNLEELKNAIKQELDARAKKMAEVEAENQLLKQLMDDNVFSVPSSFVARQLDFMVEDAKRNLMEKGFKKEDLDKRDEEFKGKFKDDARARVRLLFILDEIAAREKIDTDDNDVDLAYKRIAVQVGKDAGFVKAHYEKESLVENLKDKIREEKTIQFLLDNAQVTEKEQ